MANPRTSQPVANNPPDDLDFDRFLEELDGFGGDVGEALPDQSPVSFGEALGSIDSLISSSVHFPLGGREGSPVYSETECMTSPPDATSMQLRGLKPRAPTKKRKAKAKPAREDASNDSQPGANRRPRGRPRVYDTSVPGKGRDSAGESDSYSAEAQGKKRGAKPKYKFSTEAEAVAMRRERNRSTAISSYYRKKERDEQLLHAIECLERERDALQQLEKFVDSPVDGVDVGLLGQTLRQTCSGQQTMLHLHSEQKDLYFNGNRY